MSISLPVGAAHKLQVPSGSQASATNRRSLDAFVELGLLSLYLGLLAPNPTARKDAPILAARPQARTMTPHAMVTGTRDVTSI